MGKRITTINRNLPSNKREYRHYTCVLSYRGELLNSYNSVPSNLKMNIRLTKLELEREDIGAFTNNQQTVLSTATITESVINESVIIPSLNDTEIQNFVLDDQKNSHIQLSPIKLTSTSDLTIISPHENAIKVARDMNFQTKLILNRLSIPEFLELTRYEKNHYLLITKKGGPAHAEGY